MKTLVLSTSKGNNEVTTIDYSNSISYLKGQAEDVFYHNNFMGAYIIDNNKVVCVLNVDCEWVAPTVNQKESLKTNLDGCSNETIIKSNDISVIITKYDNSNGEGTNSFIAISKDLTIKDLKRVIKDTYKATLKSIAIDEVSDSDVLRDIKEVEGSFYNKDNTFDIWF